MGFPSIVPILGDLLMDGTEQQLTAVDITSVKHYQIKVYYDQLVGAGETVVIKIYEKRLTDNLELLAFNAETVSGTTTPKIYIKYISTKAIRVTAQQTAGTLNQRRIFAEIHQI